MPTPNPTFRAVFDVEAVGTGTGAFVAAEDVVEIDVGAEVDAEVDADEGDLVEEALGLVVDAVVEPDVVELDEADVDVTPIVVRTLGVPWN